MSSSPFINVTTAVAADICERFDLKSDGRLLLLDTMGTREFVEALVAHKQYVSGIDFMAHALPAREAIWWGSLCLQHTSGSSLSDLDRAAWKVAVRWVLEPNEQNRVAAELPAKAAGQASSAGLLAMAASQTEANASPPGSTTPRNPVTPAKAVANAVKLASIKGEPKKVLDAQRLFVELGIGVAEGRFALPTVLGLLPGGVKAHAAVAGRPVPGKSVRARE